jgi:hypothetical protein
LAEINNLLKVCKKQEILERTRRGIEGEKENNNPIISFFGAEGKLFKN